ncbi:hypothetical protein [Actinomadura parmotrematis]|uniref:Uncharacterized protein n=1 Tax=Actinomadura parmotrematis TaxID=2864039 RepID=A0ABS7FL83_9ACTN|nr:hypothetical protein [Actinomadura parmotrematis]MBW8481121.1 hypothetical protein [Actinomadura parmotrematis]
MDGAVLRPDGASLVAAVSDPNDESDRTEIVEPAVPGGRAGGDLLYTRDRTVHRFDGARAAALTGRRVRRRASRR